MPKDNLTGVFVEAFISFFGFFPTLIFGLIAFWMGKKSGKLAICSIALGLCVFVVSMVIGMGPDGRDMGFLVYVAFGVAGLAFSAVTALSYLYHSGFLGKLFTPTK